MIHMALNISTLVFSFILLFGFGGCAWISPKADFEQAVPAEKPSEPAVDIAPSDGPFSDEAFEEFKTEKLQTNTISNRELMEEARSLACTGALQFVDGDIKSARANFESAMINLSLLDLPDDMQSIEFFQPYLPKECRAIDLNKAYKESVQKTSDDGIAAPLNEFPSKDLNGLSASDQEYIKMEIIRLMEVFGEEPIKANDMEIFVTEVERFIRYYQLKRRDWFERSYERMMKYINTVESVMTEKRLPPELAYLAFIESGYLYRATSRASARGLWQFISSTGRAYGLRSGWRVDDRLDPLKSTIAAREYLLDLISIFGSRSFLLAMASYNGGEGRVQRCLRKLDDPFENRSFWQIRDCLRRETREYIPRIIGACIICENPKRFGFDLKNLDEYLEERDIVVCPRQVRLSSIAKAADISIKTIRTLNPDLPSGGYWTPSNNTHLWVPKGAGAKIEAVLDKLASHPPEPEYGEYYKVRRGDSLYKIGRRYKIPYKKLARWNNIQYPYRIKPGQKIYLAPPGSTSTGTVSNTSSTKCTDSLVYIVQRGNYLAGIGSIFGVRARDIMAQNNLKRGTIFPGQRLTICPAYPIEIIRHSVKPNETLSKIGGQYNISVDDLRFINGISPREPIYVNQKIMIYRRARD